MLNVTHAVVRSLDVDLLEVSWAIDDIVEDVYDYTFQIVRSESPMGPYEALSTPFQDRYIFIDNRIQPFSFNRILFYKILVKHKPTEETVEFGPFSPEPEADLITLELRRHMQLLYREFTGRRCWLLPARTFGQRCECWDNRLQKRTRSGCRTCFDTGFVSGYLSPIEIWAQLDPNTKNEQATNIGTIETSASTMRLVDFPPLKPRDVIIESENRRWRVNTVTPVEHVRATVLQEATINEIPHSDMEYTIPLLMDTALRDLWLSPARNFTNPQNLDNFVDEEIPRLMSLYGYPSDK